MTERWVMTERKLINGKIVDIGDDAPQGYEGRPYTRKVEQEVERIEEPAPNRMEAGAGVKRRGRPKKS